MEDDKKITIRLTPEEHQRYSVEMAQHRLKWQSLIGDLLCKWHLAQRGSVTNAEIGMISGTSSAKLTPTSAEEVEEVEALLRAKRSKDPLYAAISFMLKKFRTGGDGRVNPIAEAGEASATSKRSTR